MIKLLWAVVVNLPAILKMVEAIIDFAQEQEKKRKLKEDLNKIAEAFKNKDSNALKEVFSS